MNVLVTGGSGFIGSHLVPRLLKDGHEVTVLDTKDPQNKSVRWVQQDLGDADKAMGHAFVGQDIVFHLAGSADINMAKHHPVQVVLDNVVGTAVALDYSDRAKVKRFILASSTYIYSGHGHLYTTTKRAQESLVRNWNTLYGLKYTILRFGTVYGTGSRSVIALFTERVAKGEELRIEGKGEQARRFVHIDDIVDGCVKAMSGVAVNKTYTLVGHRPVSVMRIAELAGGRIRYEPAREDDYIEELPDDVGENWLEIGWSPSVGIEEGVRRLVEWHGKQ